MGKCDYEAARKTRMLENQARLESLGVLNTISQLRKSKKTRPYNKRLYGLTPLRRSLRINHAAAAAAAANDLSLQRSRRLTSSSPKQEKVTLLEEKDEAQRPANAPLIELSDADFEFSERMGKCDYEAARKTRILENQARLESLGVLNTISQLRKSKKSRPYTKRLYALTPLRRSLRINHAAAASAAAATPAAANNLPLQCSRRLTPSSPKQEKVTLREVKNKAQRPANAPLIELSDADFELSAESSARRCNSKGRGSVYNPVLGICCHFCRQKKLCGEEDCKRCGNCDVNEPCLGKTDCSVCHSSNGVFCRACLKVRYGEEIEEVRENKGWMCPHCIEEKGIKPYWICNSSICLRKRKMPPTGIAVYKAREMGYKSVAHLLMEELKRGKDVRR